VNVAKVAGALPPIWNITLLELETQTISDWAPQVELSLQMADALGVAQLADIPITVSAVPPHVVNLIGLPTGMFLTEYHTAPTEA